MFANLGLSNCSGEMKSKSSGNQSGQSKCNFHFEYLSVRNIFVRTSQGKGGMSCIQHCCMLESDFIFIV